jgi:hypothetical protein
MHKCGQLVDGHVDETISVIHPLGILWLHDSNRTLCVLNSETGKIPSTLPDCINTGSTMQVKMRACVSC